MIGRLLLLLAVLSGAGEPELVDDTDTLSQLAQAMLDQLEARATCEPPPIAPTCEPQPDACVL